jgi:hypothetical protein
MGGHHIAAPAASAHFFDGTDLCIHAAAVALIHTLERHTLYIRH